MNVMVDSNICFSNFLNSQEGKKIKTLLLGNGFCLDHPKLGKIFNLESSRYKQIYENINNKLEGDNIPSRIFKKYSRFDNIKCPEEFFKLIKHEVVKIILNHYIEALDKEVNNLTDLPHGNLWDKYCKLHEELHCQRFIERFEQIFTVNYDPLTYWELLKCIGYNPTKPKEHYHQYLVDGFEGENKRVTESDIIHKLSTRDGKKLYYLHGANSIIRDNTSNNYYKLNPENICTDKVFGGNASLVPAVVFESSWEYKKTLFDRHQYLTYCENTLIASKGDMLIYGLSFKNDAHIVDMLMEYASNNEKNKRNIYITYIEGEDEPKKRISNIIEKELKPYYENNCTLKSEYKFRKHLLLEHCIKSIKIAKNFDKENGGLVWSK